MGLNPDQLEGPLRALLAPVHQPTAPRLAAILTDLAAQTLSPDDARAMLAANPALAEALYSLTGSALRVGTASISLDAAANQPQAGVVQQITISQGGQVGSVVGQQLALNLVLPQPPAQEARPGPTLVRAAYLSWVMRRHRTIELPRVGETLPPIALDQVYVALRGDASTRFERSQNRRLLRQLVRELEEYLTANELSPELEYALRSRALARSPYPIALEERDLPQLYRSDVATTLTLAEAFQRERRLVCLGDPGSGKTTLIRWLALKLAQACQLGEAALLVPAAQVDPNAAPGAKEVLLGPARLPILVRIARFAEARQREPHLSLSEFIGRATWSDDTPVYGDEAPTRRGTRVAEADLQVLLLQALRDQQAVVLLDGLDEVADLREREEIVAAVDSFVEEWIAPSEALALVPTTQPGQIGIALTTPQLTGGNQIVMTSRIAGYHESELHSAMTHVTIEPMGDVAVNRFCEAIVAALFRLDPDTPATDPRRAAAHRQSADLKRSLHDPQRRGLRELASNPLLVTILALLHHTGGALPSQRVELYQMTIDRLAQVWRRRELRLSQDELLDAMAELAEHIHATSTTGLIDEGEISRRLTVAISSLRGGAGHSHVDADVAQFITVLRNDVGLLAARGQLLYGFLHLTFQEYLAGYQLVRHPTQTVELLRQRVGAPRWREPILMALGHASMRWEPAAFERLLLALLDGDNPVDQLLPRSALLITAALPDMLHVPTAAVRAVAERLLSTYADRQGLGQFATLREQIAVAMALLRQDERAAAVDAVLCAALRTPPPQQPERRFAAANLIARFAWFTPATVDALGVALPHDSGDWGWKIDRTLRVLAKGQAATPAPDARRLIEQLRAQPGWLTAEQSTALSQVRILQRPRAAQQRGTVLGFGRRSHPIRNLLQSDQAALSLVAQDVEWQRLLIALVGGLADYGAAEAHNAYRAGLDRFGRGDRRQRQQAAIALDTHLVPRFRRASLTPLRFEPQAVYRESGLQDLLLDGLRRRLPAASLMPALQRAAEREPHPERRAEALIALAALDQPIAPTLEQLEHTPAGQVVAQQLLRQVERIATMLGDPATRIGTTLYDVTSSLAPLTTENDVDGLLAALEVILGYTSPTFNIIGLLGRFPVQEQPRLLAEIWASWLDPNHDDMVYNLAVTLDASGQALASASWVLALSFALLDETRREWWVRLGVQLRRDTALPLARSEDVLARALTNLATLPRSLHFVRGWGLVQLAPLLHKYPKVLPEAILLALTSLYEDAYGIRRPALNALAPEILSDPRPLATLAERIRTLDDPYFRTRALIALSEQLPAQREQLLEEALAAARIVEPFNLRFIALDLLIQHLPAQAARLVEQLEELVIDHELPAFHGAFAWARLAFHLPPERRGSALAQTITTLKRIPSERTRALAIRALDAQLAIHEPAQVAVAQLLAELTPLNQALARGQCGPLVARLRPKLPAEDPKTVTSLAILGLSATINDLREHASGDTAQLWASLSGLRHERAVVRLQERAVTASLPLSLEAALALDQRIGRDSSAPGQPGAGQGQELAYALLPCVSIPNRETIPIVERWLRSPDRLVVRHARLLLAEAGLLTPSIAAELVAILLGDDERMQYRAALALHGSSASSDNRNRRYRASRLGRETIEVIGGAEMMLSVTEPRVATALHWFNHNLIIDDPTMLTHWVSQFTDPHADTQLAFNLLEDIEVPTPEVQAQMLELLPVVPPRAQQALLTSLARQIMLNNFPLERWSALLAACEQIAPETLGAMLVFRDEADLIAQALLQALQQTQAGVPEDAAVQGAIATLRDRYETLATLHELDHPDVAQRILAPMPAAQASFEGFSRDLEQAQEGAEREALLVRRRAVVARQLLDAFMASYYWNETYRTNVRVAAQQLPDDPSTFRLVACWMLHHAQFGNKEGRSLTTALLSVALALAERAPAAFASLDEQEHLEYRLTQLVAQLPSFPGRMAAIALLGRLRRVSQFTVAALHTGMRGSPFEQQAALDAALRLRVVSDEFLQQLLAELRDERPTRVYATAQILRALARNAKLPPHQHLDLTRALVETIKALTAKPRRDVYLMTGDWREGQDQFTIEHRGRLEETLYEVLVQISEIAGVGRSSSIVLQDEHGPETLTIQAQARRRSAEEAVTLVLGEATQKDNPISYQERFYSNSDLAMPHQLMDALYRLGTLAQTHECSLPALMEALITKEPDDEAL